MTRTQSYIIVGLAMSVVVVCMFTVVLIWIRFSSDASLVSVPTLTATYTLSPTVTLLPTSTLSPTSTATRVVPSSNLTNAEREYLSDITLRVKRIHGLLIGIANLFDIEETDSSIIYNENWQNNLAWRAVLMSSEGEWLKKDVSPPPSMYILHQDILELTGHLINAGYALEMFVDTDNSQFLETATNELLAIAPVQDRILEQLEALNLQESAMPTSTNTRVVQSAPLTVTPIAQANTPAPIPTKQKCRVRMGSTYILVDCDQLD